MRFRSALRLKSINLNYNKQAFFLDDRIFLRGDSAVFLRKSTLFIASWAKRVYTSLIPVKNMYDIPIENPMLYEVLDAEHRKVWLETWLYCAMINVLPVRKHLHGWMRERFPMKSVL